MPPVLTDVFGSLLVLVWLWCKIAVELSSSSSVIASLREAASCRQHACALHLMCRHDIDVNGTSLAGLRPSRGLLESVAIKLMTWHT